MVCDASKEAVCYHLSQTEKSQDENEQEKVMQSQVNVLKY